MDNEKYLKDFFLINQIFATLFAFSNKLQSQTDKSLATMTSRQFMTILAILHLRPQDATINNIAKNLGTSKQNAKQLVNSLEKKGYVEVKVSHTDKRAYNVMITPKGQLESWDAQIRGLFFLEEVFRGFKTEELQSIWHLLQKLYRYDGEDYQGFDNEGGQEIVVNEKMQADQQQMAKRLIEKRKSRYLKKAGFEKQE